MLLLHCTCAYYTQLAGLSVDGGETTPAVFSPATFEYDVSLPSTMRTATVQIDVDFKRYGNMGSLPIVEVNGERKVYETDTACLVHISLDEHGDAEDRSEVKVVVREPTAVHGAESARRIISGTCTPYTSPS